MGFESRAISARVTKQIVTIFSKTCDKPCYNLAAIFNPCNPRLSGGDCS